MSPSALAPWSCDTFSEFLCIWWPWWFWGDLTGYFVEWPRIGICSTFSHGLTDVRDLREKNHRGKVCFIVHQENIYSQIKSLFTISLDHKFSIPAKYHRKPTDKANTVARPHASKCWVGNPDFHIGMRVMRCPSTTIDMVSAKAK